MRAGDKSAFLWLLFTRPQTTGESSPGPAAPGAQPSSGMWQMPHTSSSVVHVQDATACQFFMVTFMPSPLLLLAAIARAAAAVRLFPEAVRGRK